MFSELIRRNSKRNRQENTLYFVTMILTVTAFLYYPCAGSSGCDDLSERDGERCCKQAADADSDFICGISVPALFPGIFYG